MTRPLTSEELAALYFGPVAPAAAAMAVAFNRAIDATNPLDGVKVSDVRIEGEALHFTVTMPEYRVTSRDGPEDRDGTPVDLEPLMPVARH